MNTTFKILPIPNKANINGLVYTKEVLDDAIKSIKDRIENGTMCITSHIPRDTSFNIYDVIGTLKRIYYNSDEGCYIADVNFIDSPLAKYLLHKYEESDMNIYLAMNKLGFVDFDKTVKIKSVTSFTLLIERDVYTPT